MIRVLQGDCREVLATLPDASVQCVVTSPPYWGLRDYGVDGQIGLESTPDAYVSEMVAVFRGVWRVLRDDGTLWLNLGDCYSSANSGQRVRDSKGGFQAGLNTQMQGATQANPGRKQTGDRPKDLLMIPARVALALQADGWWLRSDIIWAKRNCMPESVRDRPTTAHEHVFLLTKAERYYYDAVAIEEDGDIPAGTRAAKGSNVRSEIKDVNGRPPEYWEYTGKRNKRTVWWEATQPFAEAHFATMPPAIAETCILAGSSERGCCAACGAPWARQTERVDTGRTQKMTDGWDTAPGGHGTIHRQGREKGQAGVAVMAAVTTGWAPSCPCPPSDPIPCTILDPFGGAGTTGLVADRLGRNAILIELNPEYAQMARSRISRDAGMFAEVA